MRFHFTLLFMCITLASSSQDILERPNEFNDFVLAKDAELYFQDGADLSKLKFKSGRDWRVWSAIDNNPYFKTPSTSQKAGELSMCEVGLVTDVQGDWVQLKDKGWVKGSSMILAPWALRATGAVGRKALIVPNIGAAANDASGVEQRQMYRHYNLKSDKKWEGRRAKRFKVLYIFKETRDAYLLANSPKLDGTSAKTTVRGWISKDFVTEWNRKVAYGPNFGQEAQQTLGAGTEVEFFDSRRALQQHIQSCGEQSSLTLPILDEALIPSTPAFPDIGEFNRSEDNPERELLTIAGMSASMSGTAIEIEERIRRYTEQIENINLMFIVDATHSMGRYYSSISNAIEEITQWTQDYKDDVTINIGFGIYRDYLDGTDAYEANELQPFDQSLRNAIKQVSCRSKNPDMPEAIYQGFVENIAKWSPEPNHTNIIVWIGDEGNHENDTRHSSVEVNEVLNNLDASLYAFQATSYMRESSARFQQDALQWTNSRLEKNHADGIACSLERIEPGVIGITFQGPVEFKRRRQAKIITQPIKPGKNTLPSKLAEIITDDLTTWIAEVQENIEKLRDGGLIELTPEQKEEFILFLMESLDISRIKAEQFVKAGGDVSVPMFTSMKPCRKPQSNIDMLVPYVFVSQEDYNRLKKNFQKLAEGGPVDVQKDNLFQLCQQLIKTATGSDELELEEYMGKSMNQIWVDLFQVDFNIRGLKYTKLKDIRSLDGAKFRNSYAAIEQAAKRWEELPINRFEWELARTPVQKYYWIPAEYFPGFAE